MTRNLLEIAADIVQTQVSTHQMSSDQIVSSLRQVFSALQGMQKSEKEGTLYDLALPGEQGYSEEKAPDKIDPKNSIQDDKVVCLECGAEMRQLTTKHLGAHGLNPREYKKKWGFPLRQSLSAKTLSKARSKAAKKRGLPENLIKFQEDRKQKKAEMAALEVSPAAVTSPEEKTVKKPAKGSKKNTVG